MTQSPCTTGHPAPPVRIPSKASAYIDLRSLFDAPLGGQRGAGGGLEEDWSTGFWASVSESHARKLLFNPLPLGGIIRFRESISEGEKPLLFAFFGLDAGLDQIHKDAIGAGLPCLGDGMHVLRDANWKRYALTDRSF